MYLVSSYQNLSFPARDAYLISVHFTACELLQFQNVLFTNPKNLPRIISLYWNKMTDPIYIYKMLPRME